MVELVYKFDEKPYLPYDSKLYMVHKHIRECGSTLYVGLACAVPPTNTKFWLTFLLTRLQKALCEDLLV